MVLLVTTGDRMFAFREETHHATTVLAPHGQDRAARRAGNATTETYRLLAPRDPAHLPRRLMAPLTN
jgi:hypothetical protein